MKKFYAKNDIIFISLYTLFIILSSIKKLNFLSILFIFITKYYFLINKNLKNYFFIFLLLIINSILEIA